MCLAGNVPPIVSCFHHHQVGSRNSNSVACRGYRKQCSPKRLWSIARVTSCTTIAKELLNGHNVVCVRMEDLNISGSLCRNMKRCAEFKRKDEQFQSEAWPFHVRAPSKILWRTTSGMMLREPLVASCPTRQYEALPRLIVRSPTKGLSSSGRHGERYGDPAGFSGVCD